MAWHEARLTDRKYVGKNLTWIGFIAQRLKGAKLSAVLDSFAGLHAVEVGKQFF